MAGTRQIQPSDFEGASLKQMQQWVEGGTSDGLYAKTEDWKAEDTYLRELKIRVEEKLKSVGAIMQSESGEAMQNQAMPVVLWTEVTADNALAQSQLMTDQGDAFKKVQSSIPGGGEVQEVPDDSALEEGWDTFWTGSTDAEDAKAHNEGLRQEAVQAFRAYDSSSQGTVAASSIFSPPPDGGMKTTVTGSEHPNVGSSQTPSGTSSQSTSGVSAGAGTSTGTTGVGTGVGPGVGPGSVSGSPAGTGSMWHDPIRPGPGTSGSQQPGGPGTPGSPGGPGGIAGVPAGGGAGGAGGRAGGGAGGGRVGGAGGAGRAGGAGLGTGGRAGVGGAGGGAGSGSGAGGAGGRGGAGAGMGAGGRPQGKQGEEDQEHETPDYLVGDQGVFDEDLPRVAPPVFGEWEQN